MSTIKRHILLPIICLYAGMIGAQSVNIYEQFKKSTNQQLIEEAVRSGLYIVESSYLLEDSVGQQFGLDGKPYFNRVERIAFSLNDYSVMPISILYPWIEDEMASQYADIYKPILYEVNVRATKDSVFQNIDLKQFNDTINLWQGHFATPMQGIEGFALDTTKGDKDGWLILAFSDQSRIQCIHKPIQVVKCGEQTITVPSELSEVIGGVYVVPVVERVGQITFKLSGIIRPSKGGRQLTIMFPFVNRDYKEQLISKTKKGKLIPIAAEEKPGKKLRSKRH